MHADGTEEEVLLPAELWRRDAEQVSKVVLSDKELVYAQIDAHGQIADTDPSDNRWPQTIERRMVKVAPRPKDENPMQQAEKEAARAAYRPTAEQFATALYAGWTAALEAHKGDDVLVPTAVRASLEQAAAEVRDPWGRALRLALAIDPKPFQALARGERKPEYVRVATFRSAGEDGAFETGDDIVWRVMADGSTSE